MLKNTMVLVLLFMLATAVFADYYPGEKPVWGLSQDTAYLLNRGEWHLDIWGWITHGVSDDFQIGSNFLLDAGQLMNIYSKIKIMDEKEFTPAVSLGLSYYTTLTQLRVGFWDASLYLTKAMEDRWVYGALKYLDLKAGTSGGIRVLGASGFSAAVGLINKNADHWRSFIELGYSGGGTGYSSGTGVGIGGGFEWAQEALRFRLGGFAMGGSFLPVIDLNWRF